MFLKRLNLSNYRNYSTLELNFDERPTILVGNNAAGKSNILEAIYLLSTTKSQRAETEDQLIKKQETFAKIEGFVENSGETELLVILNIPTKELLFRKKVMINGVGRKTTDFIGYLPAVIFYPLDINLITGSPSLRRWHLDLALVQIDARYKKALTLYEQFLQARNKILKKIKEGNGVSAELDYWTGGLIAQGNIIAGKRKDFFEFTGFLEKSLGDFKFEYRPSQLTKERLMEINSREIAVATTLIGPHRDDFKVFLFERDMAFFGSRGEQRTATLAFKLAQLEYMAKVLGKRPLLLLDDVFSELDADHRAHVVEVVSKQQTVIATVELENIPKKFLDSARILKVADGKLL